MRDAKQILACPLNGKPCDDGHREDFPPNMKCRWWQHVYGKDPQADKVIDHWDCAVAWIPVTTLETSQMARQTAASVDKVANEVTGVKANIAAMGGAIRAAAGSISQAIEAGSLTVMLPPPGKGNGSTERELSAGKPGDE